MPKNTLLVFRRMIPSVENAVKLDSSQNQFPPVTVATNVILMVDGVSAILAIDGSTQLEKGY